MATSKALAATIQDFFKKADENVALKHNELLALAATFDTVVSPTYLDCINVGGILAVLASRLAPCPTCGQMPVTFTEEHGRCANYRPAAGPMSSAIQRCKLPPDHDGDCDFETGSS